MKTKLITLLAVVLLTSCCKGPQGDAGAQGPKGSDGAVGGNGHNAVFAAAAADISICNSGGTVLNAGTDANDDGALEFTEITATAVACNGAAAPTNGFETVELVSACGGSVLDSNNELFIRLQNGQLIGSVSQNVNGLNTHFGVVAPGTWVSTGSNGHTCVFTVDNNYNITQN